MSPKGGAFHLVEREFPGMLRQIQDTKFCVLGFMARPCCEADLKYKNHPKNFGISFDNVLRDTMRDDHGWKIGYREDLYYTQSDLKGGYLKEIIDLYKENFGCEPEQVVLVDDRKDQVESVLKPAKKIKDSTFRS